MTTHHTFAIIGTACLFPGAETPAQFWQNLTAGRSTTSLATADQFGHDPAAYYDPNQKDPDTTYFLRGGFVSLPGGASEWTHYVVEQALADSGYARRADWLARCGLIIGNLSFPTKASGRLFAPLYAQVLGSAVSELVEVPLAAHLPPPQAAVPLEEAFTPGYPAAVAARAFGLGGPHFALDAACASSLYAVALACDYLAAGHVDLMLAGAVSAADPLFVNLGFAHLGAYPAGAKHSRPLDASSDGLISGEGAGMFVLKRHTDALRDGDRIYAVVRGVGLSNDGHGKHVLTPNVKGQVLAFERAYAAAGLPPADVPYVECHASGTPVGDRTELNSMEQYFAAPPPMIGSVKANVGHLLTAAGMASMLKVILAMQHGELPATPGLVQPLTSQGGTFDGGQIVTHNRPWAGTLAAVNAFGFGGVSAHLILERPTYLPEDTQTLTSQSPLPLSPVRLAITGMDAHFGPLDELAAFARALYTAQPAFVPVPEHRWKGLHKYPDLLARFDLPAVPDGAYIGAFDLDFMQFKIPPNPADEPIMQQLLLLKVADKAIRDAGLREGANVAVIVAMSTELALHQLRGRVDFAWQIEQALSQAGAALPPESADALKRIARDALLSPAQANHYVSYIGNITASRVSSLWDFSGPTFTISSEENSAFRALEVAQLLLAKGEVEAVVVGAVDLAGSLESVLLRSHRAPLSSKATAGFSRDSDGWLVGEGAGAVVLTRAEQAAPGTAYATLDSLAFAASVAEAARQALAQANTTPAQIGYVEFHASGIAEEDAAEIEGLTAVYRGDAPTCAVGSAKAIVGHTYAASGIASLIAAALALSDRFIPAIPNWSGPERPDQWAGTPFWAAVQSRTWFGEARRAGVSSLGADGAASHLVLSSGDRAAHTPSLPFAAPYLFVLTGEDLAGLHQQLDQLAADAPTAPLHILAAQTYARRRTAARHTLALVAKSAKDLAQEIERARYGVRDALASGGDWSTPAGSAFTARPAGQSGHVAFVYPGAFNSYPKLGIDLLHLFPAAYESLREVKADVGAALHEDLLYPRSLEKPGPKLTHQMKNALAENAVAMVESGLGFAVLYTRIMQQAFGLHPRAAFGYSLGEGSMMWGMGIWRDGDAGSAALHASPLFRTRLAGPMEAVREAWGIAPDAAPEQFWAAYFIAAPVDAVRAAVGRESKVYLTHINTPTEVMIAGDPSACARVVAELAAQKGESMKAPFDVVIHNEAMLGEYGNFYALHDLPVHPAAPDVTFYSAADYAPLRLERRSVAGAISRMACKPIDFPRLVERAYADGARVFIELGPRSTCARWISETLGERPHLAVSSDALGADDRTSLVRMMARLLSHQVPVEAGALFAPLPAEHANGRKSLMRTVRPGGQDLYAAIVNAENRAKIGTPTRLPAASLAPAPTALPLPSMLPIHDAHIAFLEARRDGLRQLGELFGIAAAQPGSLPAQAAAPPPPPPTVLRIPPPTPAPSPTVTAGRVPQYPLERIQQFAVGRIADCYGERYTLYDDRRAPRIPNGDLLLVSRAVEITGERFHSVPGTRIHAEYDVPAEAWFYRDNPYPTMPYSVYMEIALQPCGFLSAYHGPTLDFPDIDFYFRNLDGYGTLHHDRDMRGRTITNQVTLLSSTVMQGIIIQKFSFAMYDGDLLFYDGEATFGYFTKEALNSQAGLDQGRTVPRWIEDESVGLDPARIVDVNPRQPYGTDFLRLAGGQLAFTDAIRIVPGGGTFSQGYAYANTIIDPTAWFFKCHFHQDPVMPGSIGVETILQAMQAYVIQTGLADDLHQPHFAQVDGGHRTSWRYRGQILSDSEKSHVEANIKRIEREAGRIVLYADASLWRDRLRIYEVRDIALAVVEG